MSTLPTRAIAHAYITEHGLQNILNRAVNACVHAKAAEPIGFIIDHLKAVKRRPSNSMVAEEKRRTAAVVPAVPPGVWRGCRWFKSDLAEVEGLLRKGADAAVGNGG